MVNKYHRTHENGCVLLWIEWYRCGVCGGMCEARLSAPKLRSRVVARRCGAARQRPGGRIIGCALASISVGCKHKADATDRSPACSHSECGPEPSTRSKPMPRSRRGLSGSAAAVG